nr:nuclear inclusion b protein [Spiranthes mosaic virus 3]
GQPSTVVDNTLMVILAMYYTLMSCEVPISECIFFVNGDDLLIAINPLYADRLSQFSGYFRQLGLKYDFSNTTSDKTQLWFMSHRALHHDGMLIPKLEPERIVSILEWDRSSEPTHRLEAICAAIIESWGYTELTHEIRKFYAWVLEQAPYKQLAQAGCAPYLAETALRHLYTGHRASEEELLRYVTCFGSEFAEHEDESITLQ